MYGERKWSNVPGSIGVEIGLDDETQKWITSSGKDLPESFQKWAKDKDIYDLTIEFESTGYYTPMSMYGGADNLGWPAEGDDERTVTNITAELQNSSEKLPKELWADLEEMFREKINEADIDCEYGEPDHEPDYDDFDEPLIDRAEDNYENWRD